MKKLINGIRTTLLVTGFMLMSTYPVMAAPTSPIPYSVQDPRADGIEWVYRTIDGKAYKRLYNYTTQQWIGDWIPC